MKNRQAGCLVALLGPTLLVGACASSGIHRSAQDLGQRLQTQLAPDIAAGQATLEPLPDGARVTLTEPSLFPSGGTELDDKGRFVLASVIEGLLEPRILQIQLAESPATSVGSQAARVRAVTQYFEDYGLGPALRPPVPQEEAAPGSVGAPPPGMTITIGIQSS
jgi:hypothetical protein